MPSLRAAWNALSRFGPVVPCVPARASVWQEPHFSTNLAFPVSRLGSSWPHAPTDRAIATAPAASAVLTVLRVRLTGAEDYPLDWRGAAPIPPPPAPPHEYRRAASAASAARASSRSAGSSSSHVTSFEPISRTDSGPTSKDISGRSCSGSAGLRVAVTSAIPEWLVD